MNRNSIKLNAEALFTVVKSRSTQDELVIICPVPSCGDRTGNRSINLKTGATNCWRCNKAHRNFFKWCKTLGYDVDEESGGAGMTASETAQLLDELQHREKIIVPVVSGVKLPRGFTPMANEPDSIYTRLIGKMAVKKNLTPEDFVRAGVGFTRDDPKWEPYAIFPVLEWDRVVYYQGRRYSSRPGESTKLFPTRSEAPLSSRYWVYNVDRLRQSTAQTAIVVESILNVLSLQRELAARKLDRDVVPVCVFKHAISAAQMRKLLAPKHIREICLMFDRDAISASWDTASRLSDLRRLTVVELPDVGNAKLDANDDARLAVDCFLERKPFKASTQTLRKF